MTSAPLLRLTLPLFLLLAVQAQAADSGNSSFTLPAGLQGLGQTSTGSTVISKPSLGQLPNTGQTLPDATKPASTGTGPQAAPLLPPGPPPKPTEFQNLVAISTGQALPVFGQEMFDAAPSTFAPVDNVPVTSDYVVGPGDELLIRGWGQVDIDVAAVVGRNGAIFIPKVGNLNVGGLRYEEVVPQIKAAVGRIYKNFDLTVSLGQLRAIQIFVVGQAKRPGSYTVSGLSTLVSALFASGGPASGGSMRLVELKRGNKVVGRFDLYDLITTGDKSRDARLIAGDVIYIPPVGKQVAIYGSVNRPAIYEARAGEKLSDLLAWAGGLATTAAGQKVTVERIAERQARKVAEFELNERDLASALEDGDLVSVYAVSPRLENSVTLRGNVAQAMRFPWREGMRISDIIPDRNALVVPDYWISRNRSGQSQSWLSQAQPAMPPLDPAKAGGLTAIASGPGVSPNPGQAMQTAAQPGMPALPGQSDWLGASQYPPGQNQPDGQQLQPPTNGKTGQSQFRDELSRGNLEVNWDYAVIERLAKDLSTDLLPFNLGKAVLELDPGQNLLLQPGDTVTVFSKRDIVAPSEKQTRFVRLEGEVANPGLYRVQAGETLRQLVSRIGGLSQNAYLFGAELNRESARQLQQVKLQELADRMDQELQRSASQRAVSAISADAQAALKADLAAQQTLVSKLRNTQVTGRIVLELPSDARSWDQLPDLPLEDGDRFFVPARPGFVLVQGSVYSQNAYIYKPSKRLTDYVQQAGGATRSADEGDTFVIRADGSVHNKRNSGVFSGLRGTEIMPGDTIVVPEDFDKISWMRELKDWSQIIYQFALGAAALKSLN